MGQNDNPLYAQTCLECFGCRHRVLQPDDGWCYMFRERPEVLPCSQHDKFSAERKTMGRLIRTRPQLLAFMIAAISD